MSEETTPYGEIEHGIDEFGFVHCVDGTVFQVERLNYLKLEDGGWSDFRSARVVAHFGQGSTATLFCFDRFYTYRDMSEAATEKVRGFLRARNRYYRDLYSKETKDCPEPQPAEPDPTEDEG